MKTRILVLRALTLGLSLVAVGAQAQLNATEILTIPASPISTADYVTVVVPVSDCWPFPLLLYTTVQPTVAVTQATPPFPGTVNISLMEPNVGCQPLIQEKAPYALPVSVGRLFPGQYTVSYTTNYHSLSLDIQVAGSNPTIVPLPGLWAISSEVNGSPGRGFQLETRGSTMVLTFYGYDSTGAGRFWLASGTYSGDTFNGTLTTYDGGATFGGPSQPAHAAGNAGTMAITFTSPIAGTITLPNESPKAISYFQF